MDAHYLGKDKTKYANLKPSGRCFDMHQKIFFVKRKTEIWHEKDFEVLSYI